MGLHQRYVEGAQANRLTRRRDDDAVPGQPVSAADVGGRLAADQPRAGAVGDQRGVQHVVDVGVHRDHGP
ncbi:hypothetical protein A5706_13885 [Mycobacterium sp. E796]|nr:hypothetical protein A5706_13885 [Mycobacterium sp. E796]